MTSLMLGRSFRTNHICCGKCQSMKFIHLKRESTNGIINSILRGKLATDLGEVVLVQSDSMRPQSSSYPITAL
jgi:hypothetical protein